MSEVEERQFKLIGLIASSTQDELSQLCVLFQILEADIENKSRLTLPIIFITELEKQLSVKSNSFSTMLQSVCDDL